MDSSWTCADRLGLNRSSGFSITQLDGKVHIWPEASPEHTQTLGGCEHSVRVCTHAAAIWVPVLKMLSTFQILLALYTGCRRELELSMLIAHAQRPAYLTYPLKMLCQSWLARWSCSHACVGAREIMLTKRLGNCPNVSRSTAEGCSNRENNIHRNCYFRHLGDMGSVFLLFNECLSVDLNSCISTL